MAYQAQEDDPNRKNQGQDVLASGSGMLSFGSSATPSEPGQAQKQNQSGSWTNLQSYLDANQDQAKGMGEAIASDVSKDVQSANDSFKASQDEFNNAPTWDVAGEKAKVDTALSDPTKADSEAYQKSLNAKYEGPESIQGTSGWATAAANQQKAQSSVDATKTEEGRQNLLASHYARPDYSQGSQRLDQMLVQRNKDAQDAIQNSSGQWDAINQAISAAPGSTAAIGKQRKDDASAVSDYANTQGSQAMTSLTSGIDRRLEDEKQNRTFETIRGDTADDAWDPKTFAALGLNPGQNLYNVDIGKYLQKVDPTKQNIATPEEYANYLALSKLMGVDPTYLTSADQSKAGTYNPTMFDSNAFKAALSGAENAYTNETAVANRSVADKERAVQAALESLRNRVNLFGGDSSNMSTAELLLGSPDSMKNAYNQAVSELENSRQSLSQINNKYNPTRKAYVGNIAGESGIDIDPAELARRKFGG